MLRRGPRQSPRQGALVRSFLTERTREGERESDVPHGGSKNSMPRLNNPSTASSVRSLRRGRYAPPVFSSSPFVRAKRENERGEKREAGPENPQGCDHGRAFHNVSSHRWTRSTGVTSTPLHERISSGPSAPKETPSESTRGPPACAPAHLPTPQRLPRSPMTIERFEKFRFSDQSPKRRRAITIFFMSFRTLKHLLDGLEKSQARADSFPCSKFYCWFYVRESGTSSCLLATFRAFFARRLFLFNSFSFLSSPHSLLFLMASHTRLSVWPRRGVVKHCVKAF